MSLDPTNGPIAVAGDDAGAVTELVESVGLRTVADIEDATVVVAVGERALLDVVTGTGVGSTPILPVGTAGGLESVPADGLQRALEELSDGSYEISDQPILAVGVGGSRRGTALTDVLLVTQEPAHISEYAVETPDGDLSTFRADGVVVATAEGSSGYARRVGGPVLGSELEALSVVPVGAFKTERNHWVVSLPNEGMAIRLSVERDDAPVSLLIDGRDVGQLDAGVPLTLERDGTVALLTVPESRRPTSTSSGSDRPVETVPSATGHSEETDPIFPAE